MKPPRPFSTWLRLMMVLCLLVASTFTARAQPSNSCQPQLVQIQVAKADAQGPIPTADALEWTTVTLRDNWRNRWPDYVGAAWYRVDWNLPCTGQQQQHIALRLQSIIMAGEVYANGDLLWRDAHLAEPLSRSWNMPRYWLLPRSAAQPGSNQIWIRVHGRADDSAGLGEIQIGDAQQLAVQHEHSWWSSRTALVISVTVSLLMSVLFGSAWLQNRSQKTYGWYALYSFFWAMVMISALTLSSWPLPSSLAYSRATSVLYLCFTSSFCIFLLRFGELRWPRIEKALWIFTAIGIAIILLTPAHLRDRITVIGTSGTVFMTALCLWFLKHAWHTRKPEHLVFAACAPLFLLLGIHDFLNLRQVINTGVALLPYSVPVTMTALALVLGRQLTLNMQRIEQFNIELTDSITRACDDLSTTLEREHALAMRHNLLQERMQISHDLHDSLGGSLVRSIAYVEQSQQPLPNAQVLSMLKLMRDDLRQMIDNGTSANLQVPETPIQWAAPMRHRFGLLFEELDLQAAWTLPMQWMTAPSAIQCLTLTRVLEEALTNVIKHSRASRVSITLELPSPQELCLRIADNGSGFDVHSTQINSMGVGMRSMLARLERIQGTLRIQSSPGATVLEARMSLGEKASWPGSAPAPLGSDAVSQ